MSKRLVILGSGYTGQFLIPLAVHHYSHVLATSRNPDVHLSYISADSRILFDLAQPKTWENIPTGADLLWCFPAMPRHLVQEFAGTLDLASRRLVVLGSTSAYRITQSNHYPPPWIDETAWIDVTKPRVQGEELLRAEDGAVVLRVAGIYGPGRNPIDWIRNGKVGPSRRYVNLIHVEDLARIILAALERATPGDVYNVSDGCPRTWNEICSIARDKWNIRAAPELEDSAIGKRIANGKMLQLLRAARAELCHIDFYQSLNRLQTESPVT